jgi:Capsule polysaccharide biosynthesis protein
MLVPVIKRVMERDDFQVTVLGLTMAAPVLKSHNIPYIGFKDLLTIETEQTVLDLGRRLAEKLPSGGKVTYQETIAYLGLSYADLINEHGEKKAAELYAENARQAFLPVGVLRGVFEQFQPDLLVSTNSPRAERAAFIVARERKIPSICIVGTFAKHEIDWISEQDYGSRICVISESVRKFIINSGRRTEEVLVTGNPAFDRLANPELATKAIAFRNARGWENKKVILWASQPEPEQHPFTGAKGNPELPRMVERELISILKQKPHWQLVIRYHPGENISAEQWPEEAYISTRKDDLAVLLNAVDVIVTMTSTVGLEAVQLNKPLITVNQSIFHKDAPYEDMGIAFGVNCLSELDGVLGKVIERGWKPKETLPEVGKATGNIINIIDDLVIENVKN